MDEVLGTPDVQAMTAATAAQLGMSTEQAEAKLRACLPPLIPTQEKLAARLTRRTMYPAMGLCWDLRMDRSAAAEICRLGERHPLVFLPLHRSYADPMILTRVFQTAGLPPTIRFAGDNLSFWPLGSLGRRTGTVFIRRSFVGDRLYALAVRSYLRYAVRQGLNLEWYPEGGRSRTGRLRPVRNGLIRDLIDALDSCPSGDAYVVPVTVSYEILPDAEQLVAEDAGVTKHPEGIRWLVDHWLTCWRLRGGRAWVSFGSPFSIRECTGQTQAGASTWRAARTVATELAGRLRAANPITPGGLLLLLLTGGHREPRDVWQIMRELKPLMAFVGDRAIPTVDLQALASQAEVQHVLERLVRAGTVETTGDAAFPRRYRIGSAQARLAAFYREQAAHWFVPRAIAELVLATTSYGAAVEAEAEAEERASRLHSVLGGLFPLPELPAFLESLHRELAAMGWPGERVGADAAPDPVRLLTAQPLLLAHRVLGGALEAALAAATVLADDPTRTERPELPAGNGALTGRWPESRSQERWRAAVTAATKATNSGQDTERRAERRQAHAAELATLVRALDFLADLDTHAAADQTRPTADGEMPTVNETTDDQSPATFSTDETGAAAPAVPLRFADSRTLARGIVRTDDGSEKP
ncbi:1-acyl-sn-glycerol-3-phosphate acyltransferase [Actinomadura fulvescens]|uniref:1-acyl-sn-glycerol-3-phosphate acyltransferase n=1 Tax=Actinomadura fulvescens TaxID=46160 RepID=UPI0031DAF977